MAEEEKERRFVEMAEFLYSQNGLLSIYINVEILVLVDVILDAVRQRIHTEAKMVDLEQQRDLVDRK